MKRITLLTLLLVFGLVLAACGPAEEVSEPVPTAEPVAEMPEEEMAEESNSIVDIAVNDGRFNTLVTAVDAAGLVETLSGEGPFTVFAPTDDAFAALPEGTLEALLADPNGALSDVLLYHVVSGAVPAADVVGLDSATTVGGEDIQISVTDGNVFLNEDVAVIITDIQADNGIIHVVDAVLLPPSMAAEELPSIAEIAAEAGTFNTLLAALQAAGLAETFAGEGEFTVFAPTDDAFAALPEGTVEALLADPQGALTDILTYHVVEGAVYAEDVIGLDAAPTMQGEEIAISVDGSTVYLNDNVAVVSTDIQASNGVIHVIDAVLLPPSVAAAMAEESSMADVGSIAEIAAEAGTFNTLLAALDAAGLAETFAGEGEFTVFAPTDEAFAALPEGTVEALLEDPQGQLTDILLYHVVEGAVPAEAVVSLDAAPTLLGQDVSITVEDGRVFLNDTVEVVTTDIQASNGIIHVIDAVLLPSERVTIVDAAIADGRFTTLVAAVEAAGLVDALSGEEELTVFAPTDEAFAALPEGTVEALLEDPEGQLTDILLYHVVAGAVSAADVVELSTATTLLGQDVTITVDDAGNVFLNDSVQVIITDIETDNGIIHVIDAVLLPAS